jgi:hypothetical protein
VGPRPARRTRPGSSPPTSPAAPSTAH